MRFLHFFSKKFGDYKNIPYLCVRNKCLTSTNTCSTTKTHEIMRRVIVYSEIPQAKSELEMLRAQAARLEKSIRRAELNAEMNEIEAEMGKNWQVISGIRERFPETDESASKVIRSIEKMNEELNARWNVVYKEYFHL